MSKRIFVAVALLGAAACATPPVTKEAEISPEAAERLADFNRAGDKVKCVSLRSISEIEPLTDDLFLVRVGVSDYYLNTMKGRCSNATRSFNRIEYRTSLSQLCANEIASVVDNSTGMQEGACAFGDFERLEKKSEAAVQ